MNANGYDILFAADANGLNPLTVEQENSSPSTGAIVYWVKLPTVSHTVDTVFYLFYGNSSISANQSNKTVVWDTNLQRGLASTERFEFKRSRLHFQRLQFNQQQQHCGHLRANRRGC